MGTMYMCMYKNLPVHCLFQVANHVLGSVLCCPGCFSVYRVAALRDVVATYATGVDKADEFLHKDMGEDRWLCTLLVSKGSLFYFQSRKLG